MQSEITGTVLPVLQIRLEPNETVISEPGQLSWMTSNVALHTTTATAGAGGFLGALGRAVSGGGLFMTEFTAQRDVGAVAFAAKVPGTIQEVRVTPGRGFLIHRSGFLCATPGVSLTTGFQRSFSAGFFGGEGFLLQKLTGDCTAWVELGGEVIPYDLPPGGVLMVHPGHVGMFEDSVAFEVSLLPGIRNKLFGGDGLFLVKLTGPGRVWLQTMTLANLAHALTPYLPQADAVSNTESGVAGGIASALIRNMFGK
jgi:uncharacterized protein (TIGR00266 family)